ncbi:MAG: hypothetical protein K9M95_04380 [Candidatus Cloacimonetes bacterium]|nr:hypothetical protein [Candidatus Cloacimonadota bacterium]
MNDVITKINGLKETFITKVTEKIVAEGKLQSYEIVWKQIQDIAAKVIKDILIQEFPSCEIIIPKSKSTYPDIKMILDRKVFAIDIKCAELQKDPWYDMARLDTIFEKRIDVYEEEWEFLIKYDSETAEFKQAYFGLFREFVGYREDSGGVKYRPYDGKLRPKTWSEFDNNVIYWDTEEKYHEGIKKSQIHRWKENIKKHLAPILNDEEKEDFKSLFD